MSSYELDKRSSDLAEASSAAAVEPLGHRLERRLSRLLGGKAVFIAVLAAAVGVGAGYGAILFRLLIQGVNRLAFPGGIALDALIASPWYLVLVPPAVGGLVVGPLVYFLAPEAKGHGVPEVMDACANLGGRIRPRVAAVKILASALSIGSGGSVGREGPIVQIGSSLGSSAGQFFGLDVNQLRNMVACGAAAGIAATFNAPIAGVLFATELILGRGSARAVSPLVIASVVATVITRTYVGNTPAFQVPAYELLAPWELLLYLVLGALAALVGVAFIKGLYALEDLWEATPVPPYARGVLGGAAVGAIGLVLPQVMGVGYEHIEQVLHWHSPQIPLGGWQGPLLLVALVLVKIVATGTTIGSGGSGGVFAPSLFMGASLGGAFGAGVNALWPGLVARPGAYALVGMGAVVAVTTQAPLTAMVIVFELTNRHAILVPLMLSCFVSTVMAMRITPDSIYTLKLRRRGSRIGLGADSELMNTTSVQALARPSGATVRPDAPLLPVVERIVEGHLPRLYVTDAEERLLGVISIEEVAGAIRDEAVLQHLLVAADLLRPAEGKVSPDQSLAQCLELFSERQTTELPVVDGAGYLLGVLSRADIIALYNREILYRDAVLQFVEERKRGRAGEARVLLGSDEVVDEVAVGPGIVGQSLRELDLRARFGVSVFAIHNGGSKTTFPRADKPLAEGQRLEVYGPSEGVEALRRLAGGEEPNNTPSGQDGPS